MILTSSIKNSARLRSTLSLCDALITNCHAEGLNFDATSFPHRLTIQEDKRDVRVAASSLNFRFFTVNFLPAMTSQHAKQILS